MAAKVNLVLDDEVKEAVPFNRGLIQRTVALAQPRRDAGVRTQE